MILLTILFIILDLTKLLNLILYRVKTKRIIYNTKNLGY